jgi:hypothetical protein
MNCGECAKSRVRAPTTSIVRVVEESLVNAWWARLFSDSPVTPAQQAGREAATAVVAQVRPTPAGAPSAPGLTDAADKSAQGDAELAFLGWLIGSPTEPDAMPGAREARALQRLDQIAGDTAAHATLLPRAAAVVPQLLARLRDAQASTAQLAQYVSRDVTLVAEVMRVANSASYRRDAAVVELGQAIRLLGVVGLNSAIARSVLKPIFSARGGELVTRSAQRLWQHTELKAQLCAELARSVALDAFEAYLAALMHNAVWSAVLRTMDGVPAAQPWCLGAPLAPALGLRRDHLFAAVAEQWQVSAGLTQLAHEVARHGLAAATSAPARVLCTGDRLATLLCMPEQFDAAQAWLAGLDKPARDCFETLRRSSALV